MHIKKKPKQINDIRNSKSFTSIGINLSKINLFFHMCIYQIETLKKKKLTTKSFFTQKYMIPCSMMVNTYLLYLPLVRPGFKPDDRDYLTLVVIAIASFSMVIYLIFNYMQ